MKATSWLGSATAWTQSLTSPAGWLRRAVGLGLIDDEAPLRAELLTADQTEQHGKSLTAFQVDSMLARQGIAVASVSLDNPASYRMLQALGAEHLDEAMTWNEMGW